MAKRVKYTDHPSIVVLAGQPRLKIFEDFFVEETLPKWIKIKEKLDKDAANKEPVTIRR